MLRYLNFNLWYYLKPPWDTGISPPELMDFIAGHQAGSAIDLGCGTGTNIITLAQHGWQVTGVDFAARAVQMAKRKAKDTNVNVSLFVDDVTRLKEVSGTFDLALDIGCFHSIVDRIAYLTTLNRILKKSGYWLLYGFFKSPTQSSRSGLSESDMDLIQLKDFQQLSRHDGTDKRGRPSAWFLFRKSGTHT